jgi:carbon-monoxide dehydrogenase small subunit
VKIPLQLRINGDDYELMISPKKVLVDVLRDDLRLTGTKKGCAEGECGACTVLMDGKPVDSCLVLAMQAVGHEITTIEGISRDGEMDAIQKAFVEHGAIQCGYCSPGFIMVAKGLLDHNPNPTEMEIRDAFAGNLCRCTGYQYIVDAVLSLARRQREEVE